MPNSPSILFSLEQNIIMIAQCFQTVVSIFLAFCPALLAQGWQTSHIDTFFFDSNNQAVLTAPQQYGFAIRQQQPPNYNQRFWIEGNIFYENPPQESDLYFIFGVASTDSIWAAGYSLSQKQIIFGRVEIQTNDEIVFTKRASKPVEIIDFRKKYVYRIIFVHKTNEVIIEVNGVPMTVKLSFPVNLLNQFGYLSRGKQVQVELMRFGGRNDNN